MDAMIEIKKDSLTGTMDRLKKYSDLLNAERKELKKEETDNV